MSKNKLAILAAVAAITVACIFYFALRPADAGNPAPVVFEIRHGESFTDIVHGLAAANLIRSSLAFEVASVASGEAFHLKAGLYRLDPAMSSFAILSQLASSGGQPITVTIPEGKNIYEIDAALANALVIKPGELVAYDKNGEWRMEDGEWGTLEGHLFPDTYQFAPGSGIQDVVQKFLDNFRAKAAPVLGDTTSTAEQTLILASILEKEVQTPADQAIVAGILEKRLAAGMYLDVDATVKYGNLVSGSERPATSSPYDTYHHKGLPPTPIGNPGLQVIQAALHPQNSPYWYYLSDPKTGKTIYARTLAEQNKNIALYLK
ncbi:MAG: endolytic transglycosylase MltG [Patescibacteria group bacterium]|nr:endolytic transglycosylase MltG [Patescibacteria group bacterium]